MVDISSLRLQYLVRSGKVQNPVAPLTSNDNASVLERLAGMYSFYINGKPDYIGTRPPITRGTFDANGKSYICTKTNGEYVIQEYNAAARATRDIPNGHFKDQSALLNAFGNNKDLTLLLEKMNPPQGGTFQESANQILTEGYESAIFQDESKARELVPKYVYEIVFKKLSVIKPSNFGLSKDDLFINGKSILDDRGLLWADVTAKDIMDSNNPKKADILKFWQAYYKNGNQYFALINDLSILCLATQKSDNTPLALQESRLNVFLKNLLHHAVNYEDEVKNSKPVNIEEANTATAYNIVKAYNEKITKTYNECNTDNLDSLKLSITNIEAYLRSAKAELSKLKGINVNFFYEKLDTADYLTDLKSMRDSKANQIKKGG